MKKIYWYSLLLLLVLAGTLVERQRILDADPFPPQHSGKVVGIDLSQMYLAMSNELAPSTNIYTPSPPRLETFPWEDFLNPH